MPVEDQDHVPPMHRALINQTMKKVVAFIDEEVKAGRIERDSVAAALVALGSRMCGASSLEKERFLRSVEQEFELGRQLLPNEEARK